MSKLPDHEYKQFNRGHQKLFLISRIAFALLFATVIFELYLIGHSPRQATPSSDQVTEMRVRGGHIFVRPVEYYLDRGGYVVGAGGFIFCLLAWAKKSARQRPRS
jgi:hypothetical protein